MMHNSVSLPVIQASLFAVEDEVPPPGMGWKHEDLLTPALPPRPVRATRGYILRHDSRPTGRLAPIVTQ